MKITTKGLLENCVQILVMLAQDAIKMNKPKPLVKALAEASRKIEEAYEIYKIIEENDNKGSN